MSKIASSASIASVTAVVIAAIELFYVVISALLRLLPSWLGVIIAFGFIILPAFICALSAIKRGTSVITFAASAINWLEVVVPNTNGMRFCCITLFPQMVLFHDLPISPILGSLVTAA